jgi:hypothetical protein
MGWPERWMQVPVDVAREIVLEAAAAMHAPISSVEVATRPEQLAKLNNMAALGVFDPEKETVFVHPKAVDTSIARTEVDLVEAAFEVCAAATVHPNFKGMTPAMTFMAAAELKESYERHAHPVVAARKELELDMTQTRSSGFV